MRPYFLWLMPVLLLVACAGSAPEASAPAAVAEDSSSPSDPQVQPRKLIRTVDLELRVDDTEAAAAAIQSLAETAGGYVASVNAYRQEQLLYYQITIKVPSAELDAAVSQVKALAVEVLRESLKTQDVTDQYIDLEARLRTLGSTEEELRSLLAESGSRGRGVDDIMAVYDKLTQIRTKIEQLQGQLNALENLTTYSTLHLRLQPTEAAKPLVGDRWQPSETVRGSFRMLLSTLQALVDLAIFLLIVLVPIAVLIAVPVWLVVRLRRLARQRRAPDAG